jgi:hypothetical protein
MALKITRDQDTFDDFVQAGSLGVTGDYYWTLAGSYRWDNASSNATICRATTSGGGTIALIVDVTTGVVRVLYGGGTFDGGTVTLTHGQWAYLGLSFSANNGAILSYWRDNGSDSAVTSVAACSTGGRHLPSTIALGSPDVAGSRSARGAYSHWRYWNANETDSTGSPLAKLDATQLELERPLATPHANKSSICVDNWKFVTNGSGDNGHTMTTTGSVTYETDEPSYISAGGSTTRGMPFGNRSTAFNGGRIFTGPIN